MRWREILAEFEFEDDQAVQIVRESAYGWDEDRRKRRLNRGYFSD